MRVILKGMGVLVVSVVAAGAWAQGNSCEQSPATGGQGCIPGSVSVLHATAVQGGVDFTGTDFDNKCSGIFDCGCGPSSPCAGTQQQPIVRFWEFNNFFAKNSGSADQRPGGAPWMINPNLDCCTARPETGVWVFFQANWGNSNVKGCISTGRVVGEVSFKDTTTGRSKYAIGSVPDATNSFFDFDLIRGANGAGFNIMPLTDVPVVANVPGGPCPGAGCPVNGTDPAFVDATIDLNGTLAYYTEIGLNDAATPLIRGVEVLWQQAAAMPATTGPGLTGGWLPVRDPANPANNLGPITTTGAGKVIAIPSPGTTPVWLTARVVYADTTATCGVGNPCSDPQGSNAPASCYSTVLGPISGTAGAVSFGKLDATRVSSNTVKVAWSTTVETGTVGFTVKRATSAAGPYTQVGSFTFATGSGSSYSVSDVTAASDKSYWYQVVETASVGVGSVGGPLEVPAAGAGSGGRSRKLHKN